MRCAALCALVAVVGASPAAFADDVTVEVRGVVAQGQGLPTLTVRANARVAKVRIALQGGGRSFHFAAGPLRDGSVKRFTLHPGDGPLELSGTLTLEYPPSEGKEDAQMSLHFVAQVVKPLAISVSPGDIDLAHGTLTLTANHVMGTVQVTVYGEDGSVVAKGEVRAKGAQVGTRVPVRWRVPSAKVLKLHVQATDVDQFYTGLDLFPWRVDVPHQDVRFASGSAEIPAEERPKLDGPLENIVSQLRRARAFANVRVFVVGHTDSVGAAAFNQKLSEARARSIARYFRAHGVAVPIEYVGLGETAPAVATADGTPEAANRRVEYVLSVGEPVIAGAPAGMRWGRL